MTPCERAGCEPKEWAVEEHRGPWLQMQSEDSAHGDLEASTGLGRQEFTVTLARTVQQHLGENGSGE